MSSVIVTDAFKESLLRKTTKANGMCGKSSSEELSGADFLGGKPESSEK